MKNIPVAGQKEYQIQLLHSVNTFIHNLKWRALFALNPGERSERKKTFGFNSTKAPPLIKELLELQAKLADLVQNIKFTKPVRNQLQDKLRKDIKEINSDSKVFVKADKTASHYKVEVEAFGNLMAKSVHKDYRKTDAAKVEEIQEEAKVIACKLELGDRIFKTSKREANITLKDHKPNFRNDPTCRLLNPCKPEIGKVSKQILAQVIEKVKVKVQYNQWKSTKAVVRWFRGQENKKKLRFLQFDIEAFYPSITPDLLKRSLDWAATYTPITADEREIIIHSKRSLLYFQGSAWVKQQNSDFDVGMGSYDGAECCDITGLFLLSQLQGLGLNIGLYRDDGLATSRLTPRQNQLALQKIERIFQQNGLKIPGAEANKSEVNFLDVTLNLPEGSFRPYQKPGNSISYVHVDSNHPPSIIRNIPLGVNKRLSDLSSSQAIFDNAIPPYQEALNKAGYRHKLTFNPTLEDEHNQPRRRCRKRRVTWFNPPFNKSVKTDVASAFLSIIDSCFPEGHTLRPTINRNTVKVSYRTMTNMAQVVAKHNAKVTSKQVVVARNRECNCEEPYLPCPLDGKCLTPGVIYKAKVTATLPPPPPSAANPSPLPTIKEGNYTGLSINTAKTRITAHNGNCRNRDEGGTRLSTFVWEQKDAGATVDISWSILAKDLQGYNPATKQCRLCLLEKWFIMFEQEGATINRRSEVFSSCRHKARLTLCPRPNG